MNLSNGTDSFAQANCTYDTRGRIATVGNNTDTLTYTYIPGTNMIGSVAWQNASINTINTYDQYKRLTNIAVNGENVYGYTLNDKNQRTSATLPDGNKWNYTYDVMGQLTGAVKQDTANNPLANMNYFYDLIGNRTSATENSATTTYASNLVNQYTSVNAVVPVYDLDGNMTNYNGWTYTYNGENRLIVAENAAAGMRVEADYDYMGRRIFKKVYTNNTLTKHSVFIYDGFKQVAEFDALNNNTLKASYLWQSIDLDIVLMRNNEYLVADGNKNIIQARNTTGNVTDSYVYDPFGKVTHNGNSENPFQFSSEIFDHETGLAYYNYRYYSPNLGRWVNRDPIEEIGGLGLYSFNNNFCINTYDGLGLVSAWTSLERLAEKSKKELKCIKCKYIIITYGEKGVKFAPLEVVNQLKSKLNLIEKKKSCKGEIIVTKDTSINNWKKILRENKCICAIFYIGHAGDGVLYFEGAYNNIFVSQGSSYDSNADIYTYGPYKGDVVTSLPKQNILQYAEISLWGCMTSVGRNIAKAFANHFGVPTVGSRKKLNFDGGTPYTPLLKGGSHFTIEIPDNVSDAVTPDECQCK